jgi:hypothetical protein
MLTSAPVALVRVPAAAVNVPVVLESEMPLAPPVEAAESSVTLSVPPMPMSTA